jgi:hypothetical protein
MQQIHSDVVFDLSPLARDPDQGKSERYPGRVSSQMRQGGESYAGNQKPRRCGSVIVHFYPDPDPEQEEKDKAGRSGNGTPEEQEEIWTFLQRPLGNSCSLLCVNSGASPVSTFFPASFFSACSASSCSSGVPLPDLPALSSLEECPYHRFPG